MHLRCVVKSRHDTRRAQDIGHQRATPRSELGQCEWCGRPLIKPSLRQRQADQLPEHLTDLGCGDKITRHAERIAGAVIAKCWMQQTLGHVIRNRDRPVRGNARGDMLR